MYENGWFLVLGHEYHAKTMIITIIGMWIMFIIFFKLYLKEEKANTE